MRIKLFSIGVFAALMLGACSSAADKIEESSSSTSAGLSDVDGDKLPEFTFNKEMHDFGQVVDGEVATYEFTFTNTGEAPLVITSARGSCGCTVPEYPRTPVAPGETGSIKVSFDSSGRSGRQDKTVTLTANTVPNTKILKITSEVIPASGQ